MFDVQCLMCAGVSGHNHELDGTRYGERCSCCPYGYHIDLDFLRYLDSLYSGESLKSLRRIRHSRSGGLTVSTSDGFFSDDELARWRLSPVHSPAPRSASSSSRVTTDEILMEIDTSMSHTLHNIDDEVDTRVIRKKKPPRPLPDGRPKENGYRSAPEEQRVQHSQDSKLYSEVTNTKVTSTQIADKFTGLMSGTESPVIGGRASEQMASTISPEILQAIREQMAVSLQRMRELEDQVRVVPLMEDQISTLRGENKRLYHLLSRLTEDERYRGMPTVNGDSGLQVEGDENVRTFRGEQGSILVELPVKVGKDELSNDSLYDRSSYSLQSTETRTQVQETKASSRREFFWGTSNGDDTAGIPPERLRLFKPSRTIGVGDGNVFEPGGVVDWPAWRKTRDVGVHCLPPSRDVSVSVSEATGDEQQDEDNGSGGAKVSLTVTVSDERRVCEPRWEVERFGTGLYQSVAIQCLIIGGFLSSDRPHMSENVDGWLVETNKLWTYSAADELLPSSSTHARLDSEPEEKQDTISTNYTSSEDVLVPDRSLSEITVERQSASLDAVLSQFYQTKPETGVDDTVREEKAVPAHANLSTFDFNAGFEKLEMTAEAQDHVVNEEIILPQSKPKASKTGSSTDTAVVDISASFKKLQEAVEVQEQDYMVKEDVIVPQSKPKASETGSGTDKVVIDVNASLKKLQEAVEIQDQDYMAKEDVIVPQSKPKASETGSGTDKAVIDINASLKKLQEAAEAQDEMVKEDVIVRQSKPKVSSSCTDSSSTFEFSASFAKLQEVHEPAAEEDVIVRQSATPKASSLLVEKLPVEDLVDMQVSSDSRITTVETKETVLVNKEVGTSMQRDGKESSDESSGIQPFPPHLSRITASSISDDDALSDQQQPQAVTVLETTTSRSVTVVEATSSSQPDVVAIEQQETSVLPDRTLTTEALSASEGEMVITRTEVVQEVTEVVTGSEVTAEVTSSTVETVSTSNVTSGSAETTELLSQDSLDTGHTTSMVITNEVGEVQQSSGEAGSVGVSESVSEVTDVSKSENIPVSSQDTVYTAQHTVVTAEVGGVQQSQGEVVPAAEVGDVTAYTATDQSQGCHVIITETRIERQLIDCSADQSQPVIIVPEDTVIQ